jgi:hypothetical protein
MMIKGQKSIAHLQHFFKSYSGLRSLPIESDKWKALCSFIHAYAFVWHAKVTCETLQSDKSMTSNQF